MEEEEEEGGGGGDSYHPILESFLPSSYTFWRGADATSLKAVAAFEFRGEEGGGKERDEGCQMVRGTFYIYYVSRDVLSDLETTMPLPTTMFLWEAKWASSDLPSSGSPASFASRLLLHLLLLLLLQGDLERFIDAPADKKLPPPPEESFIKHCTRKPGERRGTKTGNLISLAHISDMCTCPTTNGGMQNWSSVGIRTRCTHVFARLGADSYAQSVLINKNICIGDLSEDY